jgi:putative PIN family toxin of toxin-antitoxin system
MKIVLDTNVIVSALLCPQSLPANILGLVLNGTLGIVYDNNVLVEYTDVVNREKFKINKESIKAVLEFIRNDGEYTISIPQKVKFADEDDRMFYELYKSGEVDWKARVHTPSNLRFALAPGYLRWRGNLYYWRGSYPDPKIGLQHF